MIPSYISSSETSFAPASIITTFSAVPATVSSRRLFSLWAAVGLMMYSPSTSPTKTPAIGPFHGISEIDSAIDAPSIAEISGEQSLSTDMTVRLRETSLRRSFGNRGRIGRSMTREVSIAFSDGLPSLLKYPPGIFPTEYCLSSKSTDRKSIPSRGFAFAVAVARMAVSPYLTRQDPFASPASFPVSIFSGLPASSYSNTL